MKRELFICDCENTEHQIIFSHFADEPELYMTTHLRKLPFWQRLKYGIKYIFGYQSRYGAFDEFIFQPEDVYKLERLVAHLRGDEDLFAKGRIKR